MKYIYFPIQTFFILLIMIKLLLIGTCEKAEVCLGLSNLQCIKCYGLLLVHFSYSAFLPENIRCKRSWNILHRGENDQTNVTFQKFMYMMYLVPLVSAQTLPNAYQLLMASDKSSIIDLYPASERNYGAKLLFLINVFHLYLNPFGCFEFDSKAKRVTWQVSDHFYTYCTCTSCISISSLRVYFVSIKKMYNA